MSESNKQFKIFEEVSKAMPNASEEEVRTVATNLMIEVVKIQASFNLIQYLIADDDDDKKDYMDEYDRLAAGYDLVSTLGDNMRELREMVFNAVASDKLPQLAAKGLTLMLSKSIAILKALQATQPEISPVVQKLFDVVLGAIMERIELHDPKPTEQPTVSKKVH